MATLKQLISATLDAHLKSKTDSALSSTSTNPVQSKVIKAAIDAKTFPVDTALSTTSTNAVQNKVVAAAISSAEATGHQVGEICLYAGSSVPDGWFRCDGSTVSNMATNYPKLYAVLGTNVLPNYTGRYALGASSGINGLVSAGLPNITGSTAWGCNGFLNSFSSQSAYSKSSGALSVVTDGGGYGMIGYTGDDNANANVAVKIDASKSSSVYGTSTTVTPSSVKVAILIRHD